MENRAISGSSFGPNVCLPPRLKSEMLSIRIYGSSSLFLSHLLLRLPSSAHVSSISGFLSSDILKTWRFQVRGGVS